MRVVFMYDQSEPTKGSITPGSLPNAQAAFKGYQPLLITQRMHDGQQLANRNMLADATATGNSNNNNIVTSNQLHILEVLNEDVQMPLGDDTSYWCKVFEFEDFSQKQHLIKVSVWKTDSRKSFLIQFSRFVVDLCRRNALSVRHNCAPHRKWKEQWRTIFRCVYFFFGSVLLLCVVCYYQRHYRTSRVSSGWSGGSRLYSLSHCFAFSGPCAKLHYTTTDSSKNSNNKFRE